MGYGRYAIVLVVGIVFVFTIADTPSLRDKSIALLTFASSFALPYFVEWEYVGVTALFVQVALGIILAIYLRVSQWEKPPHL